MTNAYGNELFSDEEIDQLIIALGKGQDDFTEEDAVKVVTWAESVRMQNSILELVFKKLAVLLIVNGEVNIKAVKP